MIPVNSEDDLYMPATLPGTIADQLRALMPYAISRTLKANGGWEVHLKIPMEAFVTMDIDYDEFISNNLSWSVTIDTADAIGQGRMVRTSKYADVELSYR